MTALPNVIRPTIHEHALIELFVSDTLDAIRRQPTLLSQPTRVVLDLLYAQREVPEDDAE